MSAKSEFISLETILDEIFGEQGTQSREEYDLSVELWMENHKIKEPKPRIEDVEVSLY